MTTPLDANELGMQLIRIAAKAAAAGYVQATSGNFSVRTTEHSMLVTASGRDKGELTDEDLVSVNLKAPLPIGVSAEAPVHVAIYRSFADVNAVVHVHTLSSTILSRRHESARRLVLEGLEMQKAVRGVRTHETPVSLRIYANTQDMHALAAEVTRDASELSPSWAFLLSGHGIYAWGTSVEEAWRHTQAFDFLLQVRLTEEAFSR